MKAVVDDTLCSGCAVCAEVAPDVFEMDDNDIARAKVNPVPEEFEDSARDAADGCPSGAIAIED
jgi:ferredoxin